MAIEQPQADTLKSFGIFRLGKVYGDMFDTNIIEIEVNDAETRR